MLDAKQLYKREKEKKNVTIRGMQEETSENARSLARNITKFFEDHFAMCDVLVCWAHRVGQNMPEGRSPRAIVSTSWDDRKGGIILDSSKVYLKGTNSLLSK